MLDNCVDVFTIVGHSVYSMPTDGYIMTDEEQSSALDWVKKNCPQLATPEGNGCPLCANKKFNIPKILFEMRSYSEGDFTRPGVVVGYFIVECKHCGHTMLVNSANAGIKCPGKPANLPGEVAS